MVLKKSVKLVLKKYAPIALLSSVCPDKYLRLPPVLLELLINLQSQCTGLPTVQSFAVTANGIVISTRNY
jgi:hypothetical protein